jgi:hypothetical protein
VYVCSVGLGAYRRRRKRGLGAIVKNADGTFSVDTSQPNLGGSPSYGLHDLNPDDPILQVDTSGDIPGGTSGGSYPLNPFSPIAGPAPSPSSSGVLSLLQSPPVQIGLTVAGLLLLVGGRGRR